MLKTSQPQKPLIIKNISLNLISNIIIDSSATKPHLMKSLFQIIRKNTKTFKCFESKQIIMMNFSLKWKWTKNNSSAKSWLTKLFFLLMFICRSRVRSLNTTRNKFSFLNHQKSVMRTFFHLFHSFPHRFFFVKYKKFLQSNFQLTTAFNPHNSITKKSRPNYEEAKKKLEEYYFGMEQ